MQAEIRENTYTKQSWSAIHPLSPEDSAAMAALRSAVAGMKGKLAGVTARGPFNGIMEHSQPPMVSLLGQIRLEAYPAGGPNRRRLGRAEQSSICMVVGSTGEYPKRSAASSATLQHEPEMHSSPITGSLLSTLFPRQ